MECLAVQETRSRTVPSIVRALPLGMLVFGAVTVVSVTFTDNVLVSICCVGSDSRQRLHAGVAAPVKFHIPSPVKASMQ